MLTYPSIDQITQKLKVLGPGAMLFKLDISRAFRHIRIDPGDIDLLGIQHNGAYIDALFGFRHCSYVTSCVNMVSTSMELYR